MTYTVNMAGYYTDANGTGNLINYIQNAGYAPNGSIPASPDMRAVPLYQTDTPTIPAA